MRLLPAAVGLFAMLLCGGAAARAETNEIRIAMQPGVGQLPMSVLRGRGLIEAAVEQRGLPRPRIEWTELVGGAALNEALIAGRADLVAAGITPMIQLWSRSRASLGVRGIAALGSMPMFLLTADPRIQSIRDFAANDRIAVPAVGVSIHAIVLEMAAERAFGGKWSALNDQTVGMSYADAAVALMTRSGTVTAAFSVSPFQEQQLEDPHIHRVLSSYDVMGGPHTQAALYTSARFHDDNPETMAAIFEALDQTMRFIRSDPKAAAEAYVETEQSPLSTDFVEHIVRDPDHVFTIVPQNVQRFADFLYRTGQIKAPPKFWTDLFFNEVASRSGS
ncbi:sulfonate ABC transporter substrate-binding protein [Aliidongia dinghuensis]|uniref:Sulfonate ABC transporter substrate-binding protein n=1 Tax=Aliidongia dinghuensis TaxID=1867774 RepID=A0A8J2YQ05_9PROT|nr:ABC transporter substrate-binding protein [Aliidongia dinghuensis]GGF01887.1 sulfonate ABC transporter substrate-binding protein [Aliidongia dinghuensis]